MLVHVVTICRAAYTNALLHIISKIIVAILLYCSTFQGFCTIIHVRRFCGKRLSTSTSVFPLFYIPILIFEIGANFTRKQFCGSIALYQSSQIRMLPKKRMLPILWNPLKPTKKKLATFFFGLWN